MPDGPFDIGGLLGRLTGRRRPASTPTGSPVGYGTVGAANGWPTRINNPNRTGYGDFSNQNRFPVTAGGIPRTGQGGVTMPPAPPVMQRLGLNITPAQWSMLNQPGVLHQLINRLPLSKPPLPLTGPVTGPVTPPPSSPAGNPLTFNSFGNIYPGTTGAALRINRATGGTDMGELVRGSAFMPTYQDINDRSPEARLAYKYPSLFSRLV